jgi:hypothetical protein
MNLKKINLMVLLLSTFFITCAKASIPNPPTFVDKMMITDSSLRISIKDNSDNELGFRFYNEDETLFITLPSHETEDNMYMNFTGLISCRIYKFKIVAFNEKGISSPLEIVIKIPGAECMDLPDSPGLYIGRWNITDTSARISFKDYSDDELGFRVYDREKGTLLLTIPSHDEKIHPYQYGNLKGLTPCRLYKLKVVAFNDSGESEHIFIPIEGSNAFKTKGCDTSCPTSPSSYIGRYNITQTTARISFMDNSNNETGFKAYIINMDTDEKHTILIDKKEGSGSYQHKALKNLIPNTLYQVVITSFNENCESQNTQSCCGIRNTFKTLPIGMK